MTHLTTKFVLVWLLVKLSVFLSLTVVISQMQKLPVRRDLDIIYFLWCALLSCSCPSICCQMLLTNNTPLCFSLGFLLGSRKPKISLPALSISSTFYDPSICNLMVVEFPLPNLTLGKVPLHCFETMGNYS